MAGALSLGLLVATALAGLALAGDSRRSPASAPLRFGPITPGRTVAGSIIGPNQKVLADREPITVDFPTTQDGYLALRGGRLLATKDGGRTWHTASVGLRFDAVDFVSPLVGFGISGRLLYRTGSGGRKWVRAGGLGAVGALSFVDQDHGWVASVDALHRTSDGGGSWTRLPRLCGEDEGGVFSFVSAIVGFAVCGGQPGAGSQWRSYYRTDDGGNNWQQTERGIASGYISGLNYVSEQVGFESAHRLGIARLPGHKTLLLTEPADDVLSMSWPDAEHGFAVLDHAGLVRSDNGGQGWRRIYPRALPPPAGLVSFSSAKRGIGVGLSLGVFSRAGAILATADGGAGWRVRGELKGATPQGIEIDGLARISPDRLWAVGHEFVGEMFRVFLFRSADDGRHWQQVRSLPFLSDGWLSFPTARDGYTGDGDGNLYYTRDGGRTWQMLRYPKGVLQGVFLTAREGLAITDAELLTTADGGRTWANVPVRGPSIGFRALGALDQQHVWLGGLDLASDCAAAPCRGLLLRSSDGGRHWTLIRLPDTIGSGGFSWVTPLLGFAPGPYRTQDAGRTWRYLTLRG